MNDSKQVGSRGRQVGRRVNQRGAVSGIDITRRYLAILVLVQIFVMGLGVFLDPIAGTMFDKVLPLGTLVLGFYFGSRR